MRTPTPLPAFISARGTIAEWFDAVVMQRAWANWARHRYEQVYASAAASRAAHPEWPESWHWPHPIPSPGGPELFEPETHVYEVTVLPPDRSFATIYKVTGTDVVPLGREGVVPEFKWGDHTMGPDLTRNSFRIKHAYQHFDRDDLDAYCYESHLRESLALLQPACFFHGREPIAGATREIVFLDRPADLIGLRRIIPLDDPRILGDWQNPTVSEEAAHTEVVVDREYGVILEWRALFEETVYERHFFTELHFNEPMIEADFLPED